MKIHIIIPTYNDAETIIESINSIKCQTYSKWDLTIVNDGSTDETENVIKKYIKQNKLESKINYIYKTNGDQLNAIKKALETIDDEGLIFILHSDDLFYDKYVLENGNNYFQNNNPDALISDYEVIDKDGLKKRTIKIKKYKKGDSLIALQGLWLGRNLFVDSAFYKTSVYKSKINYNYLTWNTPFWLNHNMTLLNVHNSNFKVQKYREYENNYINNEIGLLNVLNGELRTEINILNHYNIPFYKFQYFIFRTLHKLHLGYKPIYTKKKTKRIYPIIKFLINKRLNLGIIKKYPYYESILNFYKNYNNREIEIKNIEKEDIFYGSDVRTFNKLMLKSELPKIYYDLFKEMNKGFNKIITNKKIVDNLKVILKFLDIDENVEIKTK